MDVMRHRYAVNGWGVGEVVVAAGVVLLHELPSPSRSLEAPREVVADAQDSARRARRRAGASEAPAPRLGPRPPRGNARPPENTLSADREQVCAESVPEVLGDGHDRTRIGNGGQAGGRDRDVALGLAARVEAHLAGRSTSYGDISIDLTWCTGFQQELADAIREVPWGEIVSYGELAALAGRPGAARAAGTFCAQSRFALIFPCHRVVSASGIGGYGDAGLALKRRLLALEGIEL